MGEGENVADQYQDELQEARARFLANYHSLGGQAMDWFESHLEPLLRVAVPEYDRQCRFNSSPYPGRGGGHKKLLTSDSFIDFYSVPVAMTA